MELAKIQDDSIKQRIKRRLLDVVYEGLDEYRQQSKQQPVPTVNVQYMVVTRQPRWKLAAANITRVMTVVSSFCWSPP